MIQALTSFIGPLALWLLKQWIEGRELSQQQEKSYYAFLEQIDKGTKVDVANYIAAGEARDATIARIKARRKGEKNT